MLRSICFILFISISLCSVSGNQENCKVVHGDDPDKCLTPCELIKSRGFKCEEHFVRTKDGYVLSVQRVINPILQKKGKPLKKPYVLQHGLFGSSAHFLVNAPGGFAADWTDLQLTDRKLKHEGKNLAYLLANFGYDIWLPNSRGNKYSTNHTSRNPNGSKFWQFTFDQMIAYDAPAVIDYILSKTLSTTLGWIGHSQGTTIMFGLLSEQPEYAAKVEPFIALAPVAHVTHIKSPLRALAYSKAIKDIFYRHPHKLMKFTPELQNLMAKECNKTLMQNICSVPLFLTSGYNPAQLNKTRLPVYIEQGFAYTSNWDLLHFAQNIVAKGFYKFDHGMFWNAIYYQSLSPPAYDLSKIKSKSIVLFNSVNDWLASPEDVATLRKSLEVDTIDHLVEDRSFNHMDFLWAKDVYTLLYSQVIKSMRRFENGYRSNYAN